MNGKRDETKTEYAIRISLSGDPKLLRGEVRSVYYKFNENSAFTASNDCLTQARIYFSNHGLPTIFPTKELAKHDQIQVQGHLDRLSQKFVRPGQEKVEFFTKIVVWDIEKYGKEMRQQSTFQTRREVKKRKNKRDMFTILRKTRQVIMDDLNDYK